eukprot:TRINITY_DN32627_c0_g1_i1.p1 TRINITY_DN32627_c0_g1~~TRINITY_DN32627_c0_g1_i1.p1  ORF type:complete len:1149 (+),score=190.69 TRINITY_DN32627_c0_g1_i1:144-3449(+)
MANEPSPSINSFVYGSEAHKASLHAQAHAQQNSRGANATRHAMGQAQRFAIHPLVRTGSDFGASERRRPQPLTSDVHNISRPDFSWSPTSAPSPSLSSGGCLDTSGAPSTPSQAESHPATPSQHRAAEIASVVAVAASAPPTATRMSSRGNAGGQISQRDIVVPEGVGSAGGRGAVSVRHIPEGISSTGGRGALSARQIPEGVASSGGRAAKHRDVTVPEGVASARSGHAKGGGAATSSSARAAAPSHSTSSTSAAAPLKSLQRQASHREQLLSHVTSSRDAPLSPRHKPSREIKTDESMTERGRPLQPRQHAFAAVQKAWETPSSMRGSEASSSTQLPSDQSGAVTPAVSEAMSATLHSSAPCGRSEGDLAETESEPSGPSVATLAAAALSAKREQLAEAEAATRSEASPLQHTMANVAAAVATALTGRSAKPKEVQSSVSRSFPASQAAPQPASLHTGSYATPRRVVPSWQETRTGASSRNASADGVTARSPQASRRVVSPQAAALRTQSSQVVCTAPGRVAWQSTRSPSIPRDTPSPGPGQRGTQAASKISRPGTACDDRADCKAATARLPERQASHDARPDRPLWSAAAGNTNCLSPHRALRSGRDRNKGPAQAAQGERNTITFPGKDRKDVSPQPKRDREMRRSPSPEDRHAAEPSGPHEGRRGSAIQLRKDRESVLKAIAAQFQGSGEGPILTPAPSRPTSNPLEFYAVGKLLGKGAFGKVNVGVHKLTEERAALKLCDRRRIQEVSAKKCLAQEVGIIQRLTGHPNIIQLFEVVESSTQLVLVMEFAAGGDLLKFVRQRRRLAELDAKELYKQLMDGLAHIHMMKVVHRDIKLENLLLDSFGCVKIADFGVAVVFQEGRRLHEHCGTPSYIAPEILQEAGYDGEPVDVWSAGIVLYAMLCGRVPFKGDNLPDLKRCILRGRFQLPPHLGEAACWLISDILRVDPRKRATVPEVLSHRFLEAIENRAERLYGPMLRSQPPEDGKPEGRLILPENEATKALLEKVSEYGFPLASVEESLKEGKFDHSTATFHLLSQQAVRKRAATLSWVPSGTVDGGDDRPSLDEIDEEDLDEDGAGEDLRGRMAQPQLPADATDG